MLKIAKFDRYDMLNSKGGNKPSFTIWFSGCHFKCKGCQNPELIDGTLGEDFSVRDVISIIRMETTKLDIDDIVLLGGEPLDQNNDDMYNLISTLHSSGKKVWLYTGYEFEDISDYFKKYLYTIKCGRYIEDMRDDSRFPITINQRVFRNFAGDWRKIDL